MKTNLSLLILMLLFSSCLPEEPEIIIQTEEDIVKYINDNNLNAIRTESGLYYVINNEGNGDYPIRDSDVRVSIKGQFLDGTTFSENSEEGVAINLTTQILGLIEGLQLFKEGGEGLLLIPSELAFNNGLAVVLEVNLIDVIDNEADILKYLNDNNLSANKTDSGLYYIIKNEGSGEIPNPNSIVNVAYTGYFLDGTVFDESDAEGITFRLDQVIPGWQEGIPLFKEGGEGTLFIPFNLGYGLVGNFTIPGGAVLVFDIELKSVN